MVTGFASLGGSYCLYYSLYWNLRQMPKINFMYRRGYLAPIVYSTWTNGRMGLLHCAIGTDGNGVVLCGKYVEYGDGVSIQQ